jgi:hypothetical protein
MPLKESNSSAPVKPDQKPEVNEGDNKLIRLSLEDGHIQIQNLMHNSTIAMLKRIDDQKPQVFVAMLKANNEQQPRSSVAAKLINPQTSKPFPRMPERDDKGTPPTPKPSETGSLLSIYQHHVTLMRAKLAAAKSSVPENKTSKALTP